MHALASHEVSRTTWHGCRACPALTSKWFRTPSNSASRWLRARSLKRTGCGHRHPVPGYSLSDGFKHQKNHALLLRAFALLERPDARLMLLGNGELEPDLRRLAAELGIADRVIFAGFHPDPTPFYRTADLFVLSSDYEGFGNVIVEALACGTPVVSTDCPSGPAEILADGEFGALVPVGDAQALARAIDRRSTDRTIPSACAPAPATSLPKRRRGPISTCCFPLDRHPLHHPQRPARTARAEPGAALSARARARSADRAHHPREGRGLGRCGRGGGGAGGVRGAGDRLAAPPFPARPRYLAPARDMAAMLREVLRAVRRDGVRLVHARSYIPAAVAWAVWRLTGTPFIFDMRALWPEELITAGRLRRGSPVHRAIAAAERACLRDAAAVVSLTHAAAEHLREREPAALAGKPVAVIPTCADLARFTPPERARGRAPSGPRVHGCIGTILSGWFRADWLAAWFAGLAREEPDARFEIVTRDDPAAVRAAVDPQGCAGRPAGDRRLRAARHAREDPRARRLGDVLHRRAVSKLGSAPTRMAEILGCGRPVVANSGVGDVARILREHRVGVLLEGPEPRKRRGRYARLT